MTIILDMNKSAGRRMPGALLAGTLLTLLTVMALPALSASVPASDDRDYDIPLSELKRTVRSDVSVKTKDNIVKKVSRPQAQPVDSAAWATLGSVRLIEEGIRMDIDGLKQKITLLLEPRNKKVVLQFAGVSYPSGAINIPLGKFGFDRARVGRHTDGTWVVLDSAGARLPLFEVLQDSDGIILKMTAGDQNAEPQDPANQSLLLTRAALMSANTHVLNPGIQIDPADNVPPWYAKYMSPPSGGDSPDTLLPNYNAKPVSIIHNPFSFVVSGRRTIIKAVISSVNEILEAYCIVQTVEPGKPTVVPMTKVSGNLYTYEATLPPTADNRFLDYSIVARDSLDNETRSREFLIPVTPSPVVPGWQQ